MEKTKVVVVETIKDIVAEFILASLLDVEDLDVYKNQSLKPVDIENFTIDRKNSSPWVLVVVGLKSDTEKIAKDWLDKNPEVVVLCVDVRSDYVNLALRNPSIDPLLSAIRQLLFHANADNGNRKARLTLPVTTVEYGPQKDAGVLLKAALLWSRRMLRAAAERLVISGAGKQATAVMTAAIADITTKDELKTKPSKSTQSRLAANREFEAAITQTQSSLEPLAVLRHALVLHETEFKLFCLVLTTEIDAGLGRWLSLLQDDVTRRSANLSTFAELLGEAATVITTIFSSGSLSRWRLIQTAAEGGLASDEVLHTDPEIKAWLLGEAKTSALSASLASFTSNYTVANAHIYAELPAIENINKLHAKTANSQDGKCFLVCCQDTGLMQAVVAQNSKTIGVNTRFLNPLFKTSDAHEANTTALAKLARRFKLLGEVPVVIWPDASEANAPELLEPTILLLKTINDAGLNTLLICQQKNSQTILMQKTFHDVIQLDASVETKLLTALVKDKMHERGHSTDDETCGNFVKNYNVALRDLNTAFIKYDNDRTAGLPRIDFDIKSIAASIQSAKTQNSFSLAQWITPTFSLNEVILPPEQKQLLYAIADTVKHRSTVLDDWKFREKALYGLGVVALFHGPSGTGKTMTAMALAHDIGIGLLRIDMSQLVSKYIGETEKNIDQVFKESTRTGAAIMCDEVEALMSKRSEGNSAVERSFNMEVAYLLQRLEAHEGLVILTTNARNSIDSAFMRRIGYDLPFAKPDVLARAKILTRCLPVGHHSLTDTQIMHLAGILNVPGGSLWQIILRAAYSAAAAKSNITIEHVKLACKAEFARLGIPISQIDIHELRRAA